MRLCAADGNQRLDLFGLQRRHNGAGCEAGVGQDRLRQADGLLHPQHRGGRLGLGAGLCFQALAGGVELRLQRASPCQFLRKRLGILVRGISGFSLSRQRGDVGSKLGAEFLGTVVQHRTDF